MSKESFDNLLSQLKYPAILSTSSETPEPWDGLLFKFHATAITILEKSKIFQDGKLRGGKDETYSIRDLKFFVGMLALFIEIGVKNGSPDILRNDFSEHFERVSAALEIVGEIVKEYGGAKGSKKISEIKKNLTSLKEYMIEKIPDFSFFYSGTDLVDNMIFLFRWQVPKAPRYTVATGIKEVLNLFGIAIEHAAIYQRMKREKRERKEEIRKEMEKALQSMFIKSKMLTFPPK